MENEQAIKELIAFSRYLSWADLMRYAYETKFDELSENATEEPVWGPKFAWMSYWYSSLFVVVEAYEEIAWHDRVVDDLLEHPGKYKDLLRRFRNGVFHFQRDLTDYRLLGLLGKNEEHVLWIHALHFEFRRLLRDRISAVAKTSHLSAEIDASLQHLLGWLPEEQEFLEFNRTVDQACDIVCQVPMPGLEELHAAIRKDLIGIEGVRFAYKKNREQLRRELLGRLGISVADDSKD